MKKFLQKSCHWLVMLIAWFAVSVSAMAQDGFTLVEFSGTNLTVPYGNANPFTPLVKDGVTVSGTGWDSTINVYEGHPLTISCPDYDIKKIELFNFNGGLIQDACTSNDGSYSSGTWTGTSRNVVISTTSDIMVYTLKVYIEKNSGSSSGGDNPEGSQETLDFVIATNTGQNTITQNGISVYCPSTYTGNCLNLWSTSQLSVTSSTYPIERIELEELAGKTITASSSPEGYMGNNVWAGTPTNRVVFTATNGGDFCIKSVHVYLCKPQPVLYTVDFVNAPDEAYIILDGQTIYKDNEGYSVAKLLDTSFVTGVYELDGYYADVTYDAENHKFTVTYVAGYRVEFESGSSWQQKNGIIYDPYWSYGSVYQTSWSGYGRVFFRSETMKINKIEILFDNDASPIFEENGFGTTVANGKTAIWTAPAEGVASDICFYSTSGEGRNVISSKVFYEPLPNVVYTVEIDVDGTLPEEFTPAVTVDGQTFTENGTYSTPKTLTENNVSASLPENGDWYYDVAYAEDTHTFTVTYKEFNHYTVSVTGCTEEGAGVKVNNDWKIYGNDNIINVKETLTAENLTVADVNGYVAGTPVVGALDGHNATITVPYTLADIKDYTVIITGMPEGASVKVEEETFSANGTFTHQSRKNLDRNSASVQNCPATHYYNDSYEWYDSETTTFSIEFTPYLVYTVAVDEASAYKGEEVGVKVYNSKTYLPGQNIYSKTELSENDVKAIDVDGFTGIVTLTDNVFTVSYTKNDFILFRASDYFNGSYGQVDDTKEGVRLYSWSSGGYFDVGKLDQSHLALTSTDVPIVKVEFEYKTWGSPYSYGLLDGCNTGSYSSNTWEGSSKDLHLYAKGESAYIEYIKVYLAKPTTYTINITGIPEGDENFYVVANYDYANGKFSTNGEHTYTTYSEMYENSVNCTYPSDKYKVTKTYNAETKTYDIAFAVLTQYNVVADDENVYAGEGNGVRVKYGEYDWRNKSIGDTFYFDGTLAESDIVMRNVDGYTGSFVLDNTAEPKTITVKYVENEPQTYTVVFAGEEVPEGASVTITDAEGVHTFAYGDENNTFVSKFNYTEASAKPAQLEFYEATVALEGTTFTVTYNKVDYIYVNLAVDSNDGKKHTHASIGGSVSVDFYPYDYCANVCSGWPLIVTSNTYAIEKIEYVLDEGYDHTFSGSQFNWGAWTTNYEVWEANPNMRTKKVELTTSYSDICYKAVKVYLNDSPVGEFAMSSAGWATLCVADEFALPEGYTAYTAGKVVDGVATLIEEEELVLTEIERVPANTPVLIKGPESDSVTLLATYDVVVPEVNFLVGATYGTTWNASYVADNMSPGAFDADWNPVYGYFGPCQLYQLANENNLVGFYRQVEDGSTLQCAAHKAFLVVPAPAAESNARFLLPGQDVITGIDSVIATEAAENIFNLQGQRVVAPAKGGVYVKNGKKIIVK